MALIWCWQCNQWLHIAHWKNPLILRTATQVWRGVRGTLQHLEVECGVGVVAADVELVAACDGRHCSTERKCDTRQVLLVVGGKRHEAFGGGIDVELAVFLRNVNGECALALAGID